MGGTALVGDTIDGDTTRTAPELILTPDGNVYIAGRSGAEFVDMPKGSIVIPNKDTKKILSRGINPLTSKSPIKRYAVGTMSIADILGTDITLLPHLDVASIEKIIADNISGNEHKTNLRTSDATAIFEAQESSGISALVLLGIAQLESGPVIGSGSSIALEKNNLWGWGATNDNPYENAKGYGSIGEAFNTYAADFKRLYYDKREMKNLTGIGDQYGYAFLDSRTIDKTWNDKIASIIQDYMELGLDSVSDTLGNGTINDTTVSDEPVKTLSDEVNNIFNEATKYNEETLEKVMDYSLRRTQNSSAMSTLWDLALSSEEDVAKYIQDALDSDSGTQIAELAAKYNADPDGFSRDMFYEALEKGVQIHDDDTLAGLELQRDLAVSAKPAMEQTYNDLIDLYNEQIAAGADVEIIRETYEAIQTCEEHMAEIDDEWNAANEAIIAYYNEIAARIFNPINDALDRLDKELDSIDTDLNKQERYNTIRKRLIDTIDKNTDIQQTAIEGVLAAEQGGYEARNDEKYAAVQNIYTAAGWEIDDLFNSDGTYETNENYLNLKKSLAASDPELWALVDEQLARIAYFKQEWIRNNEEAITADEAIYQARLELWENNHNEALDLAERSIESFDRLLSDIDNTAERLSNDFSKAIKFDDKVKNLQMQIENMGVGIEQASQKISNAEESVNKLLSDTTYSFILENFDISKWFDSNGDLTSDYYTDLENEAVIHNKELYNTVKTFAETMSVYKTAIADGNDSVLEYQDAVYESVQELNQLKIDRAQSAVDKVMEMIEERHEQERKILERVHNERIEYLQDEQDIVQKIYDRTTDLLSDVKSEEDYERQLSDEQEKADKLQARIDALSMDASDAAKMQVLELQKELNEQLETIDDLQREHKYEQTQQALQDDAELYSEYFSQLIESENEHYNYQQELLDSRYSAEAQYNEAVQALQTGTFDAFKEKGITTYNELFEKGNTVAVDLTTAYTNFAQRTGEAFDELGATFSNNIGLLKDYAAIIKDLENSELLNWHYSNGAYSETERPAIDSNPNNTTSPSNIYAPVNDRERIIIDEMMVNSEKWSEASDSDTQVRLHRRNQALGSQIGAVYKDDGHWYKNGMRLYHSEKYSDEASQYIDVLNKSLAPDEEIAVIRSDESVLKPSTLEKWANGNEIRMKMLEGFKNITHIAADNIVQTYKDFTKGFSNIYETASSVLDKSVSYNPVINVGDIIINGTNKVTAKDVENGVYSGVLRALNQNGVGQKGK